MIIGLRKTYHVTRSGEGFGIICRDLVIFCSKGSKRGLVFGSGRPTLVSGEGPFTHRAVDPFEFSAEQVQQDSFSCPYFSWDDAGGRVNSKAFWPTARGHRKPLVHLLVGDSNLGKSTLAMACADAYETDAFPTLRDELVLSPVIVIGRRFSPQEVKQVFARLNLDVDFVKVEFTQD